MEKRLSVSEVTMKAMLREESNYLLKELDKRLSVSNSAKLNKEADSKTEKSASKSSDKKSVMDFESNAKNKSVTALHWIYSEFSEVQKICDELKGSRKGKVYTFKTVNDGKEFLQRVAKLYPYTTYRVAK